MAILLGENAAVREDGRGGLVSAKDQYGRLRIFRDKYELDGTETAADRVKLMKLPAGFQVLDVWLMVSGEIAATSTVSVGTEGTAGQFLTAADGSEEGIFKMSDIAESGFIYKVGAEPEDVYATLNVAVGADDVDVEVVVIGSLD